MPHNQRNSRCTRRENASHVIPRSVQRLPKSVPTRAGMQNRVLVGGLCLAVANFALGCGTLTRSRFESNYIGVEQLFAICKVPGQCESSLACEGKVVFVKGRIDFSNVFDHSHFPSLPYEKFTLQDTTTNKALEIWAVSGRNTPLFETINSYRSRPNSEAYMQGRVVGIDLPVSNACSRNIKLEILSPEDLLFKTLD